MPLKSGETADRGRARQTATVSPLAISLVGKDATTKMRILGLGKRRARRAIFRHAGVKPTAETNQCRHRIAIGWSTTVRPLLSADVLINMSFVARLRLTGSRKEMAAMHG